MSLRNLTVLFVFFILSFANAQEVLQYKNKSYNATPNWAFICNNYALSGVLNVQIATTDAGGILKLAVETTDENFSIAGNIYVDLKDVSFIICTDKNYREYKDGQAISYYNFTPLEMKRLANTDIQSIRFMIKGTSNNFSNQVGSFTAVNKSSFFSTNYNSQNKTFETAATIHLL